MAEWRKRFGLIVGVALLAGVGAYWGGKTLHRAKAEQESLVVNPSALDFGEPWEDAGFVWEVPITNRGSSDVRVVEFEGSCACLAIEPKSLTVPAGETRSVRLTIDLTINPQRAAREGDAAPRAENPVRDFSLQVAVRLQGPHGETMPPVVWTLQGRVRTVLTVEPRTVSFGDSLIQGQPFPSRSVTVTAHTRLQDLDVVCKPDLVSAQLERVPGDHAKYELTIRPRGDVPVGPFQCSIFLQPRHGEGPLPCVLLPVDGRVLADIQAFPPAVNYGAGRMGGKLSETVVLRSWSSTPFEVERVEQEMPGAAVELVKGEAAEKRFRITQVVKKEGDQSGTVRFHVRPKGGEVRVILVPLGYLGVVE
jgi:hypothetical protein